MEFGLIQLHLIRLGQLSALIEFLWIIQSKFYARLD